MKQAHGWGADSAAHPSSKSDLVTRVALLVLVAIVAGSCGLFFLAYVGAPPFQITDGSGEQSEIRRTVPGTVTYTDGWTVTVTAPEEKATASGDVWLVPITVANGTGGDSILAANVCRPSFDGRSVDPYRIPDEVRAMGDGDRDLRLAAGATGTVRLAVGVPTGAKTAVLRCTWHAMTTGAFDLSAYLPGR